MSNNSLARMHGSRLTTPETERIGHCWPLATIDQSRTPLILVRHPLQKISAGVSRTASCSDQSVVASRATSSNSLAKTRIKDFSFSWTLQPTLQRLDVDMA